MAADSLRSNKRQKVFESVLAGKKFFNRFDYPTEKINKQITGEK